MPLSRRVLTVMIASLYLFPFFITAQTTQAGSASSSAPAYTSIVVIGDSLSDTGNDATVSAALYTVNAQVPGPATGYTNGRFTDGTDTSPAAHNYYGVWIEQLAALLSSKPTIKNSLAGGGDYAYGFATTDVGTSAFTYGPGNALSFNVSNMGLQLSTYLATHPTIVPATTLFVVWGGANDLIAATTSAQITAAAQRDANLVQQLINAGATDFIVPNLPPLGLVPRYNGTAAGAAQVNAAAQGFDQALAAYLAALPAANPTKTLHINQLDTYTLFNTIVAAPANKALANVTASAQGNTTINPDTYLFWDDLHPTTYGHSLIAASALALLSGPVNTSAMAATSNYYPAPNANFTLTATITAISGSATPMGNVTFLDGATALGSAVVTGTTTAATATLTTSFPAVGSHNITANFTGVNGYASTYSASVPVNVSNPGIIVGSAFPLYLSSGQSGTGAVIVTPVGGYTGTATLTCGALPAHFSCSPSTATATFSATSTSANLSATIGTSASAALTFPPRPGTHNTPDSVLAILMPGLGFFAFAAFRKRKSSLPRLTLMAAVMLLGGFAATSLTGCSGASTNNNNAPAGTYTVPLIITTTGPNGATTTANLTVYVQ